MASQIKSFFRFRYLGALVFLVATLLASASADAAPSAHAVSMDDRASAAPFIATPRRV